MDWKDNLREHGLKLIKESLPKESLDLSYLYLNDSATLEISDIANLKELRLNFNELKSLPILPEGLEVLYCNNNQIKSIEKLPESLRVLNVSHNPLEKIDLNSLSKCKNLQKLYLQGVKIIEPNEFNELLSVLSNLTSLKMINFGDVNFVIPYEFRKKMKGCIILTDGSGDIYYNYKDMEEMKQRKLESFRRC